MASSQSTSTTKLNPVQLHLLELFSKDMTQKELLEIRKILVEYYRQKMEEELDVFWEKKGFDEKSFDEATKDLHLRRKK